MVVPKIICVLSCSLLLFSLRGEAFTPKYFHRGRKISDNPSEALSPPLRSPLLSLHVPCWNQHYDFGRRKNRSLKKSVAGTGAGPTEEGLSIEKISVLLELTFIEACLQIATGYVDVLKLFLATLKAAHDKKIPIPELVENVAKMDETRNSANRQLTPEEISLRTLWMNLSYLTLEYLERIEEQANDLAFDSNIDQALQESLSVSISTRGTYKYIVEEKVLQFLGREVQSKIDPRDLTSDDTAQAAMMMYSLKIIDLMLTVVKEERIANDSGGLDGNGIGPPRPNIPGAF